jgi:hypothetical protein
LEDTNWFRTVLCCLFGLVFLGLSAAPVAAQDAFITTWETTSSNESITIPTAASDTTYDSFTSAALSILDTSPDAVEFVTPPDTPPKVIEVQLDSAVFDENPLTENELVTLLNGAVSVDARVRIKQTGTFAFAGDDDSLKGFNEGTWSVGVN